MDADQQRSVTVAELREILAGLEDDYEVVFESRAAVEIDGVIDDVPSEVDFGIDCVEVRDGGYVILISQEFGED